MQPRAIRNNNPLNIRRSGDRWMQLGCAMAIVEAGPHALDYMAMLEGWGMARRVQVEMPEGQVRLSATDLSLLAFDCYLVDGVERTADCYWSVKVYEWQYGQFVISYAPSTWLHSPKATCGRWCTKFHQFSV